MKIYKSKIDVWLIILLVFSFVAPAIGAFLSSELEVFYVLIPVYGIIAYMFARLRYVINEEQLKIGTGILPGKTTIDIKTIKSVSKSNNPLSSPALSLKRLEIKYGNNFDYVLISPNNRQEFVNDLLAINPDIVVKL